MNNCPQTKYRRPHRMRREQDEMVCGLCALRYAVGEEPPAPPHGNVLIVWTVDLDNKLCDLVAEDRYSFAEIAVQMNLPSRNTVTSRWRRIVAKMGWQAA